jgi:exopolysaccharide biosynthesis polyprenyl glycosylphosphotransferase
VLIEVAPAPAGFEAAPGATAFDVPATLFPGFEGTAELRKAVDEGIAVTRLDNMGTIVGPFPAAPARSLGTAGMLMDLAGLSLAATVAAAAQGVHAHSAGMSGRQAFADTLLRLTLCLPVLVAVLATTRRPAGWRLRTTFAQHLHEVMLPLCGGGLACLMVWRLAQLSGGVGPAPFDAVMLTCALGLVIVPGARVAYHVPPRRHGRRARRVVILGSGLVAERMRTQLMATAGVHVVGFVDDDPKDPSDCLGSLRELSSVCEREHVDHVIVAFSRSQPEDMIEVLRPIQGRLPITVVPRLFDVVPMTANVQELAYGFPGISVAPGTFDRWQRTVKRTADVVGAGLGLVVLSPLLAAVALAVRMTSSGPVLLRQARVGRNGQVFSMFKFRTMVVHDPGTRAGTLPGEPACGPFPKLKHDPRVTKVGRILRRASIDELPQLLNVVRGEMALVGPRPFMLADADAIGGWALRRYAVRPGITGLWQVSGRNDLTYEEMCRLDHLYVSCWSMGLDVRIMLRTLRAVGAARGAY